MAYLNVLAAAMVEPTKSPPDEPSTEYDSGSAVTTRWGLVARRVALAVAAALLFATGIAISRTIEFDVNVRRIQDSSGSYMPSYSLVPGPQLVMVYIGAAGCAWSNHPSLPAAVEKIKLALADRAAELGMTFRAVGVAVDWAPAVGIEHLSRFGRFDEVSAGYNWGNTLAMRYFWDDLSITAATPQIIIYRRTFVAPSETESTFDLRESDRTVLKELKGHESIGDWAESDEMLRIEIVPSDFSQGWPD